MKIIHMSGIRILIALLVVFTITSLQQKKGTLIVKIKNIRNEKGSIKLSLFNSEDGFPSKAEKAIEKTSLPIKNNSAEVIFKDLPYGNYAIALLHDENNNNKMDFQFYGMPKEGYGASNDAKATFGPPSFKDAAVLLDDSNRIIEINLRYF